MSEANVLHTMNFGGNVHETAAMINERLPELVDYVVQMEFGGGYNSLAVFRAPATLIARLKAEKRI